MLEAVLRGMEAREQALIDELHGFSSIWVIDYSHRRSPDAASPRGPEERQVPVTERLSLPYRTERFRGEYLVQGDSFRQEVRPNPARDLGRPVMLVLSDGRSAWRFDPEDESYHVLEVRPGGPPACAHAYEYLGLLHSLSPDPDARLSAKVRAREPRLVREERVHGRDCFVIEYGPAPGSVWRETTWVCPDYGYAVLRDVMSKTNDEPAYDSEMTREYGDFREFGSIHLPAIYAMRSEIRRSDMFPHELRATRARAEKLEVNEPIDPELFVPPRDTVGAAQVQVQ